MRITPGFDNPRSVSACVPEAFALPTSLSFFPSQYEFELEAPPVSPSIVADLDNDGVNDVLFITTKGLYGYLGKSRRGATVITATITCVIALLALLFLTHRQPKVCFFCSWLGICCFIRGAGIVCGSVGGACINNFNFYFATKT